MAKFEITKPDDRYMFTLVGNKVKVLLESDLYPTKAGCEHAVDAVKSQGGKPSRFKKNKDADGRYFYEVEGDDGRAVARSRPFDTEQEMQECMETVLAEAAGAVVEDATGD